MTVKPIIKLQTCMCKEEIITYENNDTCKQSSVIVLTRHIECDFSLKVFFFFSLPLSPPFIINHPETANWCNFLFVSTFVGDFGEHCLISVQRDCNLENKRRKLRWDGV